MDNEILKGLFERIARDDRPAFERLYNTTWRLVTGYFHRVTQCEEEARDLAQSFYIRLWIKRASLSEVSNPGGFIMTCLRRQSVNYIRREKMIRRHREAWKQMSAGRDRNFTMDVVEGKQLSGLLHTAIQQLAESQQQIFHLRQHAGLSYENIARLTSYSLQTCQSYYSIVTKQLRSHFQHYMG